MSLFPSLARRGPALTAPADLAAEMPSAAPTSLAVAVACGRCGGATERPADFPARGKVWALCTACQATRTMAEIDGISLALAVIRDALGVMLDPMERTHVEYAETPGNCPADRLTMQGESPDDAPGPERWWWLDLHGMRLSAEGFRRAHQPRRAPGMYPCADCGQSHSVAWHQGANGVICDDCQHRRENLPPGGDITQDFAERLADVAIGAILGRDPVTFTARMLAGHPDRFELMPRAAERPGYGPTDRDRVPWHFVSDAERERLAAGWAAARERAERAERGGVGVMGDPGRPVVERIEPDGTVREEYVPTVRDQIARFEAEAQSRRERAEKHMEKCAQCRAEGAYNEFNHPSLHDRYAGFRMPVSPIGAPVEDD
ncbi:hypothetical protein [Micromonospora aurantiaca (nom. illeg.)]|uniref:hypothetical protein n=2 Tax=Micromonospora TaxID=1873 RepID=UPI000828D0D0|nr:hypothetical protein [Micromonospora aurantiaca]SCL40073.1 hypothetical protein GA0070615_4265 [Micromonospora aurantiaca]